MAKLISGTAPETDPKQIAQAAAAEENAPPWIRQVALLTGVLAALGAFLTVRSTTLSNDAIYRSTKATLLQAQASDKWAEYEADSIKANIAKTQLEVLPTSQPASAQLQKDQQGFRDRQPIEKDAAQKLESQRDDELKNGNKLLNEKDIIGFAGMASQFSIALASVAALTRRRPAFYAAIMFGLVGFAMTGYAFALHYVVK